MAKIHIERAYIEPYDQEEDLAILFHVKQLDENGNPDHILIGKVELDKPIKWLYTETNDVGDLEVNCSSSMEANKWDYLTKEIIGDIE
jgi:hypothetical protein